MNGQRRDLMHAGGSSSKSTNAREKKRLAESGDVNTRSKPVLRSQRLMRPEEVTEEVLEVEKSTLLEKKQTQLEKIFDRHDTMVRELYRMDTETLMLEYNPQEAKTRNTPHFQQYKAPYDLVEKAQAESGPSRRTRATRSEKLSLISSLSHPSPVSKKKQPRPNAKYQSVIQDSTSSTRRGQERRLSQGKPHVVEEPTMESISAAVSRKDDKARKGRAVLSAIEVDQSSDAIVSPSLSMVQRGKRKSISVMPKTPRKADTTTQKDSTEVSLGRRSSRLKDNISEAPPAKKMKITVDDPDPMLELQQQLSPKGPPLATEPDSANLDISPSLPPPPTIKIKRIKLLVRRPPPNLTHHKQRPPPPKFNSSLHNFLTSYTTIGSEEVNDEIIASRALEEAKIREREANFRRQGRFIPGTDVLFGSNPNAAPYVPPKRTSRDAWDDIVEIISINRSKIPKKSLGQQITAQIASKIQAYWDGQEARKDKIRALEEKRLKALAKATVKMVTVEWKKAVYHIREKQRLKAEEEERRRGHEHLDAILDQSGQLLETQQGDLRKAKSRSSSMDVGLGGWGQDEDEDEDEDEEVETEEDDMEGSEVDMIHDIHNATSELVEDASEDGYREHDMEEGEEQEQEEEDEEGEDDTALLLGPSKEQESGEATLQEESMIEDVGTEGEDDVTMDFADEVTSSSRRSASSIAFEEGASNPGLTPGADTPLLSSSRPRSLSPMVSEIIAPAPRQSPDPMMDVIATGKLGEHEVITGKELKTSEGPSLDAESGEEEEEEEEVAVKQVVRKEEEEEEEEEIEKEKEKKEGLEKQNEEEIEKRKDEKTEKGDEKEGEEKEQADRTVVMQEEEDMSEEIIPEYLRPFAVTHVDYNPDEKIKPPLLLRGILRPYQQSGLEWLASLHSNNLNGILADEMGLGKTIQTISLLAHLACDRGIWGPHLIIVPTSVLLNWEMEFKKFMPGFKVLSYHGSTKRRKELRQGWNDKHHFNVCITSYTLASRDAHIFKRKAWYYMILDEAHMIKNFKSQRWNILLMFRSFRRLLLTGTPLQNNLTELWALLQFLMSGSNFANLKEFGEWFSNPLEKAIEMGNILDDETMQRVSKLHTVLRPYLLRRLKRDVEKELPSKYEHLVLCPLSKRQRFLYDEFMSRAQTREDLDSGVYQRIANILMQLRKVCNHPDLFEVRPIVTSFAMQRSAIADFEIKELLIRKHWLKTEDERVSLDLLGLSFIDRQNEPLLTAVETRYLSATTKLPHINDLPGEPLPKDMRTFTGYRRYKAYMRKSETISKWQHVAYLNELRCSRKPIYSSEIISKVRQLSKSYLPFSAVDTRFNFMDIAKPLHKAILSYDERAASMANEVNKFAFVTPPVVALDLPQLALKGYEDQIVAQPLEFDQILHPASVKFQIAFPDPSLLQYDCGKLQELKRLLQEKKAGGHRILIFTQMTRILDILEIFLSLHGYLYLRLDGATKIEDRQYITERFNADPRIFCFIASSRSGGVGINLTGADTVVFYDSDFNPQMDKQCEDRAHRIGQIRDVHIYRFVSQHTVEEAMLRKANQKRSLDDLVIQKGEFDWRTIFSNEKVMEGVDERAVVSLTKALGEYEDVEDARAAAVAAREEYFLEGADNADFGIDNGETLEGSRSQSKVTLMGGGNASEPTKSDANAEKVDTGEGDDEGEDEEDEEDGGSVADYMLAFVERDYDLFKDWRL